MVDLYKILCNNKSILKEPVFKNRICKCSNKINIICKYPKIFLNQPDSILQSIKEFKMMKINLQMIKNLKKWFLDLFKNILINQQKKLRTLLKIRKKSYKMKLIKDRNKIKKIIIQIQISKFFIMNKQRIKITISIFQIFPI